MWNPRCPGPRHAVRLLAVALLASACSGGPGATDGAPSGEERVAAIVDAREAVVAPAQALGTAAAEVAARLDQLVARPDDATIDATRAAVDDLASARAEVADLALDPETEDVRAASAALDDAAAAAQQVEAGATEVLEAADLAADADDRLEEFVAAWDEPGSRSELTTRFEEVAASAESLAAEELATATPGCPGPVVARREAATFVAQATEELTELVTARDGLAFDERRAELAEAPFGTDDAGVVRGPGASIDPGSCPAVGDVEDAAMQVAAALRALQQALNPEDLAS